MRFRESELPSSSSSPLPLPIPPPPPPLSRLGWPAAFSWRLGCAPFGGAGIETEDEGTAFLGTPTPSTRAQQEGLFWCSSPPPPLIILASAPRRQEARRSSQSIVSLWFRSSSVDISASTLAASITARCSRRNERKDTRRGGEGGGRERDLVTRSDHPIIRSSDHMACAHAVVAGHRRALTKAGTEHACRVFAD